jgi:hypothetical protein
MELHYSSSVTVAAHVTDNDIQIEQDVAFVIDSANRLVTATQPGNRMERLTAASIQIHAVNLSHLRTETSLRRQLMLSQKGIRHQGESERTAFS